MGTEVSGCLSLPWFAQVAPCQGVISGLCRIFPSDPFFASLQLHVTRRVSRHRGRFCRG